MSASGNTSQVVIATTAATPTSAGYTAAMPPSADNEGILPNPAEQAWNIASALQLPSQSSSSTRTRTEKQVDELNRVAETMQPASSKRGVTALDDILLSGREVPGSCRKYRMNLGHKRSLVAQMWHRMISER